MENIPTKNTGDSYTSSEFNESNDELKNSITDGGQTLTPADDFQISKSMAVNAAGATFYVDSGAADAYVLSKAGTVSLRSPVAYFEGMAIRFRPDNINTGASTVNVTALGVKTILKPDGVTALSPGDIATDRDAEARFDVTADAFFLMPGISDATKTGKGLAFLGDQRITLANNAVDLARDIDFSGGLFTFDDGTGEQIVSALTKQLDAAFVIGNNQGGNVVDTFPGNIQAETWYHCFAINNPTTGGSDYMFDTSVTGANIPTGFTKKRRIGAIRTDTIPNSRNIILFNQIGKRFYFGTRILETTTFVDTNALTLTLTTPVGVETVALVLVKLVDDATSDIIVTALDEVDLAPAQNNADVSVIGGSALNEFSVNEVQVKTNLSSQIRIRISAFPFTNSFFLTKGYIDLTLEG